MARVTIKNLDLDFPIYGIDRRRILSRTALKQMLPIGGRFSANTDGVVVVKAVSNLSIELRDGDRVGLIGHNGAGKSTLLRGIAGILPTSRGTVEIEGDITALFEMGLGLDMDASGYENIRILATLRGAPKKQIDDIIQDVEDFTGLGSFLAMPLRTYSSGMRIRLAFGTVTARSADVLIMDEGIGAGDAQFQDKAAQRLDRLYGQTPILVMASHADDILKRYCNKGLVLKAGEARFFGSIDDALSYYSDALAADSAAEAAPTAA